jgi:hypothetical protein
MEARFASLLQDQLCRLLLEVNSNMASRRALPSRGCHRRPSPRGVIDLVLSLYKIVAMVVRGGSLWHLREELKAPERALQRKWRCVRSPGYGDPERTGQSVDERRLRTFRGLATSTARRGNSARGVRAGRSCVDGEPYDRQTPKVRGYPDSAAQGYREAGSGLTHLRRTRVYDILSAVAWRSASMRPRFPPEAGVVSQCHTAAFAGHSGWRYGCAAADHRLSRSRNGAT